VARPHVAAADRVDRTPLAGSDRVTAAALDRLGPDEKRALLRRLLAERAASGVADFPLAHGQRALWFLQRLFPDTYAYNVAFSARIDPALDIDAFRRALDRLVARHQALRTVFPEHNGQAVQRVLPPAPAPLRVVDMAHASDDELRTAVADDYRRPFDPDASLFAVTVYRRHGHDVLLLNVHHLVFDAWSLQILFDDLRALYDAELKGEAAALPPLAARYRDFVAGQNAMLDSARGQALSSYWEQTLAGIPTTLELTDAYPRSGAFTMRGATLPFSLDPALTAAVHALARRQHTTLYTVMLAAMHVMLHRFSGQSDIVVGTPVSMRSRDEFTNVIGYFINMVPVRGRLLPDEPFSALLARTRESVLGALEHQDLPFPLLVDRLRIQRDPRWNPIFQAMLNVNVSSRASELSRLFGPAEPGERASEPVPFGASRMTPYPIPQQEGQFDIVIEMTDTDGVIHGNLKYQVDRLPPEAVRDMRETFIAVLATITERPDVPVSDLAAVHHREDFEL
jgi:hypothetical protein